MKLFNSRRYILWILPVILTSGYGVFARNDTYRLRLENGVDLNLNEHESHRWLPQAYYDRAIDSINAIYPENRILVRRRYGTVGNVVYSLIAYKETKANLSVIIKGVVVKGELAWIFSVDVPEFKFNKTLVLLLEKISRLPSRL